MPFFGFETAVPGPPRSRGVIAPAKTMIAGLVIAVQAGIHASTLAIVIIRATSDHCQMCGLADRDPAGGKPSGCSGASYI